MQQADRSQRSVFVGNIPYDATEEKLRDIFSAAGPVLSFRIVFDRETGKPKGYGFCEYEDEETAKSAMRNLNGHDLGGRLLRVDSASNERARDEPDKQNNQQQQQQQQQSHMGGLGDQQQMLQQQPVAEPLVDAQTVINNVLCSLAPENLFEICKQLKLSLLVNPNETRQMLVQNPQLSFAVLQTLVMIKAIDAQTAMNTLHKQLMQPAPLQAPMPAMMTMMQPQVMAPYPFVNQQPGNMAPIQPAPQPVVSAPAQVPTQLPPMNPTLNDPRLNQPDPRMAPAPMDPRLAPADPRLAAADPRLASADPRLNSAVAQQTADPRLLATDPRLSRQPQQITQQQQQQQPQQQNPQQIHPPGWPYVGV